MITKTTDSTKFISGLEDFIKQQTQTSPAWLDKIRKESLMRFFDFGIPTVRDEEWKYTNLSSLLQHHYLIAGQEGFKPTPEFNRYCDPEGINIVFINGIFSKELSNLKNDIKGLKIQTFQEALAENPKNLQTLFEKYSSGQETTFISLNKALTKDGILIEVDKNAIIEKMIHVLHLANVSQGPGVFAPRTLVSLGKSSEATLLESHMDFSDHAVYFTDALTDIFIDENATLHYCKAQTESLKSFHIGQTRVWQERSSNFEGFSLMTGGAITRNNLDISLNGEGASALLNGLYCANGTQLVDNHTAVDHRTPNCTSNQYYKGILNGSSRGVFNGKIFVRPIAQKTNSYQLNKNLLLGQDALANTKPQLEIFADDVKCTHGATIGQLNEDELFYLQTRCISKREAIRMLSKAFIDDIIETIKNPSIRAKMNVLLEPIFAQL